MDKRRFWRFDLPGRAEVVFEGAEDQHIRASTRSFSRQGISLDVEASEAPDSGAVRLAITPAWEPREKIALCGRIAWQKKHDGRCRLGVVIEEMDQEKKSDLLSQSYCLWQTLSHSR